MKKIETFKVNEHFLTNSFVTTHIIGYETNEMHNHDFIEFFYVLQGSCLHNYNNEITSLQVGEAFLLTPSDKHQFLKTQSSKNFLHRDFIFTFEYFKSICDTYYEGLYDDIINKKYSTHFSLSQDMISLFESIIPNMTINLSQNKFVLTTKIITKYIINILLSHQLIKQNPYPSWLTKIIYYMNSQEITTVPLKVFLKSIPLSQSYMCHEFKKQIGVSMTDYLNTQKMKHAYTLLRTTNLSTEEICEKIGFNNVSHFYTLFNRIYKTTPAKVRIKS